MGVPEQVSFLDILLYFFIGLLGVFVGFVYFWNFFDINVIRILLDFGWIGIILIIALSYLLGILFAKSLFAFMLSISVFSSKRPINKVQRFLGNYIFGIKQKPDVRIVLLEECILDNQIKKKIKNIYSIEFDKLSDKGKSELFYIVMRYVDNFMQGKINRLDRLQLRTNIIAAVILVLIIVFVINLGAMIFSFFNVTFHISLVGLISINIISIVLIQILSKDFQKEILLWFRNIWRCFLVIENPMSVRKEL